MNFACASCAARYAIPDEKVREKTVAICCRQCGEGNLLDGAIGADGVGKTQVEPIWFAVIDREQVGPFTIAELRAQLAHHQIDGDTYCWRAGLDDWCKLSQIEVLRALLPASPLGEPKGVDLFSIDNAVGAPIIAARPAGLGLAASPSAAHAPEIRISLSLPRLLSREPAAPPPDPLEQAFSTLDRGWFSVDAPSAMLVGLATKISAGAIRKELNRRILQATLEHDRPQVEAALIGKLLRVELVPDSEEDFSIRALSEAEQPVLASEVTRWEWLVTPRQPGPEKVLRVMATNLVDVDGRRLTKSHPVKTLTVRVQIRPSATASRAVSTAALRRAMDHAFRADADFEAFCIDYFPAVFARFARGMERVEKVNLLFSQADGATILDNLCLHSPEAGEIFEAESSAPEPAAPLPPAVSPVEAVAPPVKLATPAELDFSAEPDSPATLAGSAVDAPQKIVIRVPLALIVIVLGVVLFAVLGVVRLLR